jgi:glycosyltransferase involved in cell wall biosynthesis
LIKFEEVIAVSNYTKNLVTNLELENVTVIQNGFNINILNNNLTFSKFNFYPNLITLGNVSYRKGQHNVIEAIPKLKENFPNIHYHIVGIPTEKNVLISRIKDLQIEENVTFYGKVSETEKNVLLLKSDVFIMLSDKTPEGDVEGFGIAIVEANSLGKPSIGSINTGIEDAILNHKSGILVNPKNIEEVNKSVKEIIDFYDEYSRQAQLWSQNFSWKKIIKRYIKVIQK